MKHIYACYSDSHLELVREHLLPSIPIGFDLFLRKTPQSCPSGTFLQVGWETAMQDKVNWILWAIEREREPFVLCDVDLRFYAFKPEDVENDLGDSSIAYQLDDPVTGFPCAGFALIRPCAETHLLYSKVLAGLKDCPGEQISLTGKALPEMSLHPSFHFKTLDPVRYWNRRVELDKNKIVVHHANWITGVREKRDALQLVQFIMNRPAMVISRST
jgi:hypothetical protein